VPLLLRLPWQLWNQNLLECRLAECAAADSMIQVDYRLQDCRLRCCTCSGQPSVLTAICDVRRLLCGPLATLLVQQHLYGLA
jgi:hypothetical protein